MLLLSTERRMDMGEACSGIGGPDRMMQSETSISTRNPQRVAGEDLYWLCPRMRSKP